MAELVHLSFSIGPVQAFVAQARRTRDLWAGSWLLSYLAETALAAAERKGNSESIIPHREDEEKGKVTSTQTAIGGYPNRFELRFKGANEARDAAKAAEEAFHHAWWKIADAVWKRYVDPIVSFGNGTEDIWKRQIKKFWELSWVIGSPYKEDGTIGHLAAQRKNFRNVQACEEPGTKCLLMPTLQEISGHFGLSGGWDRQKEFWNRFKDNLGSRDLKDTERLCSISLIKRLFPLVIKQAIIGEISSDLEQVAWPSTAFLAALPWLRELETRIPDAARAYATHADQVGFPPSERDAARRVGIEWASLDGPAWFDSAVRTNEDGFAKEDVLALRKSLKDVYQAAASDSGSTERRPVPYYALLLMDGDSLGALLDQLDSPQKLSMCLSQFAKSVEDIAKQHDGRTVYAGGDDVLALLPAKGALGAATGICNAYREAFKGKAPETSSTISAAIVYAHWRYPLRQVIRTAHHLLDDVAKDGTGRDSVAQGIILGSGLNAVWSVPWKVFSGEEEGSTSFESLLDYFGSDESEAKGPRFNASYLYLLREQFSRLFDKPIDQPGEYGRVAAPGLLGDMAHAEFRRRIPKKERTQTDLSETKKLVDDLMSLTYRWTRDSKTFEIHPDRQSFSFDGWRLARFLKQVKDGKVDDHD